MAKRGGRVLIAGGGIGGLAAAIALGQLGESVTVLERSTFGDQTGAGIQLGPNATRALRAFGVLEAIGSAAFKPEAIWLFDGLSGKRLTVMPLGTEIEARHGAPYLTLHRADLHAALLSACEALPTVELRANFEVAAVRQHEKHVEAASADGTAVEGTSLIGADGLWSTIRGLIAPGVQLRFAGATASRATLPREGLPTPFDAPVVGLWLGPRAHLVHYPMRGGKDLNLVAVTQGGRESQGWDQAGDPQAVLSSFALWQAEVRALLAQAGAWRSWSLYSLPPLARWDDGRIALLGDAAHPVLPYLAQGAGLAIEDAAALAAVFDAHEPSAAFRRYAALRQPRAARVQRTAQRFGRLYHLSGPLRFGRNFLLERRRKEEALARFDWLYGE